MRRDALGHADPCRLRGKRRLCFDGDPRVNWARKPEARVDSTSRGRAQCPPEAPADRGLELTGPGMKRSRASSSTPPETARKAQGARSHPPQGNDLFPAGGQRIHRRPPATRSRSTSWHSSTRMDWRTTTHSFLTTSKASATTTYLQRVHRAPDGSLRNRTHRR